MKALILGCSHAAGAEMYRDTSITIEDPVSFGWLNSYPVLIAKQLGYKPLNYAISGGSNDAMFRIFVEQLENLTPSDIVIACWTGPERTEIWHAVDNRWLPLSAGQRNWNPLTISDFALSGLNAGGKISLEKEYQDYCATWTKFHINLQSGNLNKLKNILALNALAKLHSIPVLNINSFAPISGADSVNWALNDTFCAWADRNNHPHTEFGHYFLSTHRAFANLVVDNLKNLQPL